MKHLLLAGFIFLVGLSFAPAQPFVKAVRISTPPEIDGYVNEAVWNEAFLVNEFYQREPVEGAPVSERTEMLICYDANNIYFGIRCWDDPKKITAKEMARDVSLGKDDRVQIILDTYLDHRNGYWFQIGPRGSIGDAIVSENGAVLNKQWDGLWTGKAKIVDYGWEAEIAIPFKTLGFDKESTKWGLKLIRNIVNKLETAYWPVANLNAHKFQVSDAGIIDGIENITQGIGLDIAPYLITGLDTKRNNSPDTKLNGGLDLFYQITPSLKSSISINTDFAETEVDDRQINLTRFSLHYPEKRDFFLDGANYFQFGIEADRESPVSNKLIPFFSRRMGLESTGDPIPIHVAAKVTGQQNNWNLGFMYINDGRETGENNFSVARVSRNIGKLSSAGIISTYGNSMGEARNLVTGADVKLATSTFQKNKNVALILFGLKSNTKNTTRQDFAWGTQLVYPNDFLKARAGYHQIGKNFYAGMGFVPRTNISEKYASLEIGPRPNKFGILQVIFGGNFGLISNLESGITETREVEIKPLELRLLSGEEISYTIANQYENFENDFSIFNDIVIPAGNYNWWQHRFSIETKGARDIWGEAGYHFGRFYNGERQDIKMQVNWKVAVPFFVGSTVTQNRVQLPAGSFTANIFQLNANILFSPDITLYNYLQYDNASNTMGWQSRFQWIIKPGNEIILAWTSNFLQNKSSAFYIDDSAIRLKIKYNIRL